MQILLQDTNVLNKKAGYHNRLIATELTRSRQEPSSKLETTPSEELRRVHGYLVSRGESVGFVTPIGAEHTGQAQELVRLALTASVETKGAEEADVGDIANESRLVLLARKYAQKRLSPEETARLEIVTERVRQLAPSVGASDFERVDAAIGRLQEIAAETTELRQKLGLSPERK